VTMLEQRTEAIATRIHKTCRIIIVEIVGFQHEPSVYLHRQILAGSGCSRSAFCVSGKNEPHNKNCDHSGAEHPSSSLEVAVALVLGVPANVTRCICWKGGGALTRDCEGKECGLGLAA
jgi:hypothetical protein